MPPAPTIPQNGACAHVGFEIVEQDRQDHRIDLWCYGITQLLQA